MKFRKGSFFGRLLMAFFLGGFIPFLCLSILFVFMTGRVLERTYGERADEAVGMAAQMFRSMLSDSATIARVLAEEPAVVAYCEGTARDSAIISDINRLLASVIDNPGILPYIIPSDGGAPLSRASIPKEYNLSSHGGWGILGELARSPDPEPTQYFAQPHPLGERLVPIAIGTVIRGKRGRIGYLIFDIEHKIIEEKVGLAAKSGGALTDLIFIDKTACVIYDMTDSRREASFFDPESLQQDQYFSPRKPVAMGIEALGFFPKKAARDYAQRIMTMALGIASVSALIFFAVALWLARATSSPIHLLTLTMKEVADGRLDVSCPELAKASKDDEVATLIIQFNKMIARVNELVKSRIEQERNQRFAELKALQAQINPHFIYNTLNSIRSVAKLKGDTELAYVSTSLARIIREGSASGSNYCTLGHSVNLAKDYFAIEDWRWPGRFKLVLSVEPALLEAKIPRLIVQPLVENALSHGLEGKAGGGTLRIGAELDGGDLSIIIADDGIGIAKEMLASINENLAKAEQGSLDLSVDLAQKSPSALKTISERNSGCGIGLLNTHRRLLLIYGKGYGLTIRSASGEGTVVRLKIPYSTEGGEPCSR